MNEIKDKRDIIMNADSEIVYLETKMRLQPSFLMYERHYRQTSNLILLYSKGQTGTNYKFDSKQS